MSSEATPFLKRSDVVLLSKPQDTHMAEQYFEIVDLNHFWAARRLEVLIRMGGQFLSSTLQYCEIGCGNGILQSQLHLGQNLKVDGFELSLPALERNRSASGTLYNYDVLERRPEFKEKYDGLFLFDVLEHLLDDLDFLQACLFHLKPGGHLFLNVPARPELFSRYDTIQGHVRRYTIKSLTKVLQGAGLEILACTYWGLPLYFILLLRKWFVARLDDSAVYTAGFTPPTGLANTLLKLYSRLEWLPQKSLGTSILAVVKKPGS
jgi:SAM-dependent methyltransferase